MNRKRNRGKNNKREQNNGCPKLDTVAKNDLKCKKTTLHECFLKHSTLRKRNVAVKQTNRKEFIIDNY